MVDGYQYAATIIQPILAQGGMIEVYHILDLVGLIEPDVNVNGFRVGPVSFADGTVLTNHRLIADQVAALLRLQAHVTPAQFYQEYEEIHPCADGNGRAGAILFNLLGGTLDRPLVPPPFKRGRSHYESSFGEVEA